MFHSGDVKKESFLLVQVSQLNSCVCHEKTALIIISISVIKREHSSLKNDRHGVRCHLRFTLWV